MHRPFAILETLHRPYVSLISTPSYVYDFEAIFSDVVRVASY